MQSGDALLDHLFRRAGFGASATDLQAVAGLSYAAAVDYFVDYDKFPDDVDSKIGLADYVGITSRGQFSPSTNIEDARQRWLFRMLHTRRHGCSPGGICATCPAPITTIPRATRNSSIT